MPKHRKAAIQRMLSRAVGRRERALRALLSERDAIIERLPKTHQEAAQRLTDWPALATVDYRNKVVKTPRDNCHPQIVEFYVHLNRALAARGFPFYAFEFYRSPERQKRLKAQGVSKAGAWESPHNFGCAVDIVHAKRFWDIPVRQWSVIGAIGKEVARKRGIPIVWGGDWSFYDPAHWELEHWRNLRTALRDLEANGVELPTDDALRFAALEEHWRKLAKAV